MSTDSKSKAELGNRKAQHLEICTDPDKYRVEGTVTTGFEALRFVHKALPELTWEEIDTTVSFLGHSLSLPFFISCMTGGSEQGFEANRALALAAQAEGVAVGMGSVRILLEDPSLIEHFHLKSLAPDVPVLANLGAVQLRELPRAKVVEVLKRLEVQAVVIHLNPAQELFQKHGDRDFRGLFDAIARLCEQCPIPVIVKETGFGISPAQTRKLLTLGAAFVDLAGAGGTNWVVVESYREPGGDVPASLFRDWGLPTAYLLAALGDLRGRILASGGIRTGLDVGKSLALGAELAGAALPLARAVVRGGCEAVREEIRKIYLTLKAVMLLTGCGDVAALRKAPLWRDPDFEQKVRALKRAEEGPER